MVATEEVAMVVIEEPMAGDAGVVLKDAVIMNAVDVIGVHNADTAMVAVVMTEEVVEVEIDLDHVRIPDRHLEDVVGEAQVAVVVAVEAGQEALLAAEVDLEVETKRPPHDTFVLNSIASM